MTDVILVFLLAAATILPAIAAFVLPTLRRAIIAMAICAFGSALLLLYAGQAVLAMLQLFVFAGGSATYSIIAVADEKSGTTRRAAFLIAALLMGAFFMLLLQGSGTPFAANSGGLISAAGMAFESQYALLYVAVFILFAAAMINVVVIKSFSKRYF